MPTSFWSLVEAPVTDGAYLVVWWRIPHPERGWPHVEAFRVQGEWVREIAENPE
jgi:hypothetical protein